MLGFIWNENAARHQSWDLEYGLTREAASGAHDKNIKDRLHEDSKGRTREVHRGGAGNLAEVAHAHRGETKEGGYGKLSNEDRGAAWGFSGQTKWKFAAGVGRRRREGERVRHWRNIG